MSQEIAEMVTKKIVVFDFDGVIHSYTSGWQGESNIPDPPVPGIKEAFEQIRQSYYVAVVSTRCANIGGLEAVTRYLSDHGITVDYVMAEKPPAVCYIDDRAICFDGDCASLLEKIKNFRPWYEKGEENGREKAD